MGTTASRCLGDVAAAKPMKVTRVFSALSLKAPWNCVTIRLQKPRREEAVAGGIELLMAGGLYHPHEKVYSDPLPAYTPAFRTFHVARGR